MTPTARTVLGTLLAISAAATAARGQDVRLVTAAANQDRSAVHALLAAGVDVNAPRADGATALLWAAHWNDMELVERLLAAGADVNLADDHGVTALERATENASIAMVERLLDAGANANAAQESGLVPLMDRRPHGERRHRPGAHRPRGRRQRGGDRDRQHGADVGGVGAASGDRAAPASTPAPTRRHLPSRASRR